MRRRCLFLFGAGASAHSVDCKPNLPPIGDRLFDTMVTEGLIPQTFNKDYEALFRSERGFEQGMEALASDSAIYLPFLRSMAILFSSYRPGESNLYVMLFRSLLGQGAEFAVATLNYENLIELSLDKVGAHRTYTGTSGRRIVRVIKPHGSCGFLPDLQGNKFYGVSAKGTFGSYFEGSIVPTTNQETIQSWCVDPGHSGMAPSMSFYAPGKWTPVASSPISQQRADWKSACESYDICLVVGVRCNPSDTHIWQPLADSKGELIFVNPASRDTQEFDEWAAAHSRKASVLRLAFEEALQRMRDLIVGRKSS